MEFTGKRSLTYGLNWKVLLLTYWYFTRQFPLQLTSASTMSMHCNYRPIISPGLTANDPEQWTYSCLQYQPHTGWLQENMNNGQWSRSRANWSVTKFIQNIHTVMSIRFVILLLCIGFDRVSILDKLKQQHSCMLINVETIKFLT